MKQILLFENEPWRNGKNWIVTL